MTQFLERAVMTLSIVFMMVGAYLMLRPGGIVRVGVERVWDAHVLRKQIDDEWDSIVANAQRIGSESGRVTLVVFGNYRCRYCRLFHDSIAILLEEDRTGRLAYVPLSFSRVGDEEAARASVCAAEQGSFERMHNFLFETRDWEDDPDWLRDATAAGIDDSTAFLDCMGASSTTGALVANQALARRFGVNATPSLMIRNMGVRIGMVGTDELRRLLTAP